MVSPQRTIFTKETNVFGSGFTTKNHIYKRNQCIWKWFYHKEPYLQKKPMYLEVVSPQRTIFTKETNAFGSDFTTKNHIYKRNQCIWKKSYHKEPYLQKKPMHLEVILPQRTIFTRETNVFGSGFTTKNHIYKRNQCIWK